MKYLRIHKFYQIRKHRFKDLSAILEYDIDPKKAYPMLHLIPDMNDPQIHHHIKLTKIQCRKLRDFLNHYLRENFK
jgi:hypothetical protein